MGVGGKGRGKDVRIWERERDQTREEVRERWREGSMQREKEKKVSGCFFCFY